jgi:hypothetical protein
MYVDYNLPSTASCRGVQQRVQSQLHPSTAGHTTDCLSSFWGNYDPLMKNARSSYQDGTDMFSRNVGNQLPTYAAWHPRRSQLHRGRSLTSYVNFLSLLYVSRSASHSVLLCEDIYHNRRNGVCFWQREIFFIFHVKNVFLPLAAEAGTYTASPSTAVLLFYLRPFDIELQKMLPVHLQTVVVHSIYFNSRMRQSLM